jgi:hypothetical protein
MFEFLGGFYAGNFCPRNRECRTFMQGFAVIAARALTSANDPKTSAVEEAVTKLMAVTRISNIEVTGAAVSIYSSLIAPIGSILEARYAGPNPAANKITVTRADIASNVGRCQGDTPKNAAALSRVQISVVGTPTSSPTTEIQAISRMTSNIVPSRVAPNAIRIPISFTRRAIPYETVP